MPEWPRQTQRGDAPASRRRVPRAARRRRRRTTRRCAPGRRRRRRSSAPLRRWPIVAGDVRYALRTLRKHPGFTAVVLADARARHRRQRRDLLASSTPCCCARCRIADADRLVVIWGDLHRPGVNEIPASAGEYVGLSRSQPRLRADRRLRHRRIQPHRRRRARAASTARSSPPASFRCSARRPQVGRHFLAGGRAAGPRTTSSLLSHALWTRRFNANPAIVGQTVAIDGRPARGRRRDAGGVPVSRSRRSRSGSRSLLDAEALSDEQPRLARLHGARAAEARRHAARRRRPIWPA